MKAFPKVTTAVAISMLLCVAFWAATRYGLIPSPLSTSFLPHQFCYLQNPSLIWTNAVADGLIWLAYIAIATGFAILLRKTESVLGFRWIFVAFGLFIVACGFTHFFEVVTIWKPVYWLSTSVKVLTAVASIATAIAFVPLVPRAARAMRMFTQAYSRSEERRLQALSKLLDSEERMRLASESSGFATWERSLITGELYWDARCRALFGVSEPRKLYYEDFLKRIHPEDRAATQALIESSLDERHEYDATFRIQRDDGEIRTVISRGKAFLDEYGRPERLVGIILDITRERQAQEALMRAERLAVAGRMAASIAHEINNPLEAATGFLYLSRTDSRVPDDIKQHIELADQELQRAAKITRSTLTFYRESITPVHTNLGELVSSVIDFQQARIRKAGVSVETKFADIEPIIAYPGELRQVFTNLISNAIDAMRSEGKLSIRIHPARDWRTEQDGYAVLIADNGSGIPPKVQTKLFGAFFSTKGEKGTGLGLWISKQLIEKNGGTITFRSCTADTRHPTGTTFKVWIPASLAVRYN